MHSRDRLHPGILDGLTPEHGTGDVAARDRAKSKGFTRVRRTEALRTAWGISRRT